MNLATCPHCGADLEALHSITLGNLTIEYDGALIHWRGRRIDLNPSHRLIVMALVRANGAPMRRCVLAEAAGYEGENADNIAAVYLSRIKALFRAADVTFDRIENVRSTGVRWKTS